MGTPTFVSRETIGEKHMHRIRATQVRGGGAVDIDLDEAGIVVRGNLNETDPKAGTVLKTYTCTIIYLRTLGANGTPLIEYVVETPDELYAAPEIKYGAQPAAAKPTKNRQPKKADGRARA
jgi:hypothetical protein